MKYFHVLRSAKLCEFVIFFISFNPAMLSRIRQDDKTNSLQAIKSTTKPPMFDEITTSIDARVGETVLLPCTVRNLGEKLVAWMRKRDLHILTCGEHTYSADNRIETVHSSRTDFWGVRIRGVKLSDSGRYECQVNTDPKMSLSLLLNVTDSANAPDPDDPTDDYVNSVALIKGPAEVHVGEGSPVTFTCEIIPIAVTYDGDRPRDSGTTAKAGIEWRHDGAEITYQRTKGILMDVDYRQKNVRSTIKIASVTRDDEGVYACNYPLAKTGSVRLFVLSGEHTEAMQRDAAYVSSSSCSLLLAVRRRLAMSNLLLISLIYFP